MMLLKLSKECCLEIIRKFIKTHLLDYNESTIARLAFIN
jgi:hypothetical protein